MALLVHLPPAVGQPHDTFAKALEVLKRTKQTSGTYSLYLWNRITRPGQEPVEEWSAEFHLGHLHRVETPRDRVVADCKAGTGSGLTLTSGRMIESTGAAAAACGINTNAAITRMEWLGTVSTPFRTADRVRITDRDNIRIYDVSGEGVLIRTTYADAAPDGGLLLTAEAVQIDQRVPEAGMFSEPSLRRSFVPDKFKQSPPR